MTSCQSAVVSIALSFTIFK